jgi:hypothetical protein
MAVSGVSGLAVAAAGAGGLLLWSGIKGANLSKTVRSVVSGNQPAGQDPALAITASYDAGSAAPGSAGPGGAAGAAGGTAAQNQAIARLLCGPYGWSSGPEWDALVSLWDSESNWSNTIWNTTASCGGDAYAYGIVQACGHGPRMSIPGHGSVAPYPAGNAGNPPECGGSSNASAQISWGLAYIKQNYGSPSRVPHGGY